MHPIARDFADLLRLLLACGSMDALGQAHLWDRDRFQAFLEENRPTPEQAAVLHELERRLALSPICLLYTSRCV